MTNVKFHEVLLTALVPECHRSHMCVMCPGCDWPRLCPAEMLAWARHRDGGMCAALPLAKTGMLRGNLCRAVIGQDEGIRIIISLLLGLYWMQTGTQHRGGEQRRIRYLYYI